LKALKARNELVIGHAELETSLRAFSASRITALFLGRCPKLLHFAPLAL
jgi:hypothetical protein